MAKNRKPTTTKSPTDPPGNLKHKVGENIGLAKVLLDIVDVYVGSAAMAIGVDTSPDDSTQQPDTSNKQQRRD